jgi:hypothetical protein
LKVFPSITKCPVGSQAPRWWATLACGRFPTRRRHPGQSLRRLELEPRFPREPGRKGAARTTPRESSCPHPSF